MKKGRILVYLMRIILFVLLLFTFFYPRTFKVNTTYNIKAPPSLIYKNIQFLKNQSLWSPWDIYDRGLSKRIISEDGLEGATLIWEGDNKAGQGEVIWEKLVENKSIDFTVIKNRPWKTKADCRIQLMNENNNTELKFSYSVKIPFPWNISMLFKNFNRRVKNEYNYGFNNLKQKMEDLANKDLFEADNVLGIPSYLITQTIKTDSLYSYLKVQNKNLNQRLMKDSGVVRYNPLAFFYFNNANDSTSRVAAAYPLVNIYLLERPLSVEKTKFGSLELGNLRLVYNFFGEIEYKKFAHQELKRKIKKLNKNYKLPIVEEYIQDYRNQMDTNLWHTRIYYYLENKK